MKSLAILLDGYNPSFSRYEDARAEIEREVSRHPDIADIRVFGRSMNGAELYAVFLGRGSRYVFLLAGSHADEPVGPVTLGTFCTQLLKKRELCNDVLQEYTFIVVPHINPDGAYANAGWIDRWPSSSAYLTGAVREAPCDDIEFSYPSARVENRALTSLWKLVPPCSLYVNFHGMGFSEGLLLLIERHWIERTRELQDRFRGIAERFDYTLHDHDRKGEKGFEYIGPGFTTTPEGKRMRAFFLESGDTATAECFQLSSMEWIRRRGGDPLCLVTEMPLFVLSRTGYVHEPGIPGVYNRFKEIQGDLIAGLHRGDGLSSLAGDIHITPVPLATAVEIHLLLLEAGLNAV